MGKRPRENETGDRGARKAPKGFHADAEPAAVHIGSAVQLRQLLRFTQDNPEQLRRGQLAFKTFLNDIANVKSESDDIRAKAILREYLDGEPTDMQQTWSFASQTDNERLVTAVTSNFALLLKTLSPLLEFRERASAVARSLLQPEQLKLFSRGLTAESHKEAIISPCLRILTEILPLDGGSCAALVFKHQGYLFNTRFLDRNLRLSRASGDEDRRNSSVRSNTIRYLLAHLRFQDVDTRIKIADMRSTFRNWLENLKNDPPELIHSTLKIIETNILREDAVPRKFKSAIISDRVLASIVDHIRSDLHDEANNSSDTDVALKFLRSVCTNPDLGVLLPCSWYPSATGKRDDELIERSIFEAVDPTGIRNPILSKFIQHLRPHVILSERELLLAVFRAAPELVADFFRKSAERLSLQQKLTNTWIGYSSMVYSIIDLPIPHLLGATEEFRDEPPPNENAIENILPTPLTRPILTKCLNQNSDMITFFALRIMVVALQKLNHLVEIYGIATSKGHETYEDCRLQILAEISQKLPTLKDIALTFKNTHESKHATKEAAAHLLSLHQSLFRSSVVEEPYSFDAAAPLASAITLLQSKDGQLDPDDRELLELQLTHLLDIAEISRRMEWWQRPGNLEHSAFMTIVQLCVNKQSSSMLLPKLRSTLALAAFEHGEIFQQRTDLSTMDVLLASLEGDDLWTPIPETWRFINDCVNRCIKRPIKYLDDLDEIKESLSITRPVLSLFVMVLLEQVPFTSRMDDAERRNILTWVSKFFTGLLAIKEDKKILKRVKETLETEGFKLPKSKIRDIMPRIAQNNGKNHVDSSVDRQETNKTKNAFEFALDEAPQESVKHPELIRHSKQDVEDLIFAGTLQNLLLTPCSAYPEIRKQGFAALESIVPRIKESNIDGKEQYWVLIIEVLETARSSVDKNIPMSFIAGSFAVSALKVLSDPSHFMFPMINRYLMKDPYWNVNKLPEFFLDKALLDVPDEEDKYWPQLEWILEMFLGGIRRAEDVHVLESRSCFERILNIVNSPEVTSSVARLVFQLIHRVVLVDGSTGLIMNAGLSEWLAICGHGYRWRGESLAELSRLVEERADSARLKEWNGFGEELSE
ncbi:hypothetical protein ANO11243_082440 [Dothideomycetidae sp. 11243]|nr:hypothetical protein ANO11243_082440 [fungal sp. No.11243]